jgi:diacylglycerol kinase (ATP)
MHPVPAKNQPFFKRLSFAIAGLMSAARAEHSFRLHLIATIGVIAALAWLRPAPAWWAIIILTVVLVLAAELINTAVENLADHLHPESHPQIKVVKDCAAAAVLITSIGALAVATAFVWELLA